MTKIIFISGAHGVGKSTFCTVLQKQLSLPHYSSSSLIKQNSQEISLNKLEGDADRKQIVLLDALDRIDKPKILLDGHFCLLDSEGKVKELQDKVYYRMKPSVIVHITCPPAVIHQRLLQRDSATFSVELLEQMQQKETNKAVKISRELGIPLLCYQSGSKSDTIIKALEEI